MRQESPDLPVTSFALLGLLTFGDELTGYELKQRADLTLRFYWTAPAMSQVYTELARLADPRARGHRRRGPHHPLPDHRAPGRRACARWMDATPAGFPVLKHPVALRLLMGHVTDRTSPLDAGGVRRRAGRQPRRPGRGAGVAEGADAPGEAFRTPRWSRSGGSRTSTPSAGSRDGSWPGWTRNPPPRACGPAWRADGNEVGFGGGPVGPSELRAGRSSPRHLAPGTSPSGLRTASLSGSR